MPWQKVYTKRGDRLHDSHVHGDEVMTVEQILVESSNIGTITVSETMAEGSSFERQDHYMRLFGLGERTALNFPDETPGILKPWQQWEGTEKYTVAYGQGVASSPIQLVAAVNAIANDGTYVAPKLVEATVDADGEVREMPAVGDARGRPARGRRADAADDDARSCARARRSRPGSRGCRSPARPAPASSPSPTAATTAPDGTKAYYASFVGFLPAEDPQVTILVSIDQPPADSGDRFGGTAAAPVFRELAPTMIHELGHRAAAGLDGLRGVSDGRVNVGGPRRATLADARACRRLRRASSATRRSTVTAMTHDSRRVAPGTLFACVRGAHHDGHDFAAAAVAAGARGAARRPRARRRRRPARRRRRPAGDGSRRRRASTATRAGR